MSELTDFLRYRLFRLFFHADIEERYAKMKKMLPVYGVKGEMREKEGEKRDLQDGRD